MRWLVLLLLLCVVPLAHAHPFTEETVPSATKNGDVGLTSVMVRYSEDVEITFSSLKVYDGAGNQIDNRDTSYYDNERSLMVTTPPLDDGIYTVASKVLSRVDGHLVPDTFTFAVGSATLDISGISAKEVELVFLPEAGSRFLGIVGQTILAGAIISSLLVWRGRELREQMDSIRARHHRIFANVTGIALLAIFASNILALVIYAYRLESFSIESLQSPFGMWWIIRMVLTVGALGLWFVLEKRLRRNVQFAMLFLAMVILWTSSQIGHPAATGQIMPVILDYIHNVVAAAWIGGLAYASFVLLPSVSKSNESARDAALVLTLPRFSPMFVACLGVVVITGPLLLWFLESDVASISGSLYGQLIIAKVAIAIVMVGLGGYHHMTFSRVVGNVMQGTHNLYGKLRRTIRIEMALGMLLLGVVALLVNGTLPAGELRDVQAADMPSLSMVEFTGNARFSVEMEPYAVGLNTIYVRTSELNGSPVSDETGINVKISNPSRNISPVSLDLQPTAGGINEYSGEVLFGFAGQWLLEVESQRGQGANESISVIIPVTYNLNTLKINMTEYELPETVAPLYPVYDGDGSIWVGDATAPRLWKFNIDSGEFRSFQFNGSLSIFLDLDKQGRVWFTDNLAGQIGYLDTSTEEFSLIPIPELNSTAPSGVMSSIRADHSGDIWVSLVLQDTLLRYDVEEDSFREFKLSAGSLPYALTPDPDRMWFAANSSIGHVNLNTDRITILSPDEPFSSAEALIFDRDGNLWITEHTGSALAMYDPGVDTFTRVALGVPDGLPFGMALDAYDNIWIAQHVVDVVVVYDPRSGAQRQVSLPVSGGFVQFVTADDDGRLWFVGQQSNSLIMADVQGIPSREAPPPRSVGTTLQYTEFVSPLMAAGILAASLFFVKSVWTERRLRGIYDNTGMSSPASKFTHN